MLTLIFTALLPLVSAASDPCAEMGINYYGNEIEKNPMIRDVDSWQICGDICFKTAECKFWTWNSGGNKRCYLKTSDQGRIINPTISGRRGCPPGIISFLYHVDERSLFKSIPQVLGRQVVTNHCPKKYLHRCPDQSKGFSVSKTTESTRSWQHTAGVSISVGTEFKAGIPALAEGKISTEITGSYSHTWGKSETESKTWTSHDACVAGAGTKVTCEFFVNKKELNVPFTILWSNGKTTTGMYKGVDFLRSDMTVKTIFLTEKR